jgi:hypothetical protein
MHRREFRYPRRLPTLLSPLILGKGEDLRVLRIRSRRDVPSGKDLRPFTSLKESVEEVQPEVENAPEMATKPEVEEVPEGLHPEDGNPNASRVQYHIGRSGCPRSIVMGNHDEWVDDHEETATNYVK